LHLADFLGTEQSLAAETSRLEPITDAVEAKVLAMSAAE
jgi:hypothetical protein